MSFTQTQIEALKVAIATGALTVRNANGETVTYRPLTEMRETLAAMDAEVSGASASRVAYINPTYSNGC